MLESDLYQNHLLPETRFYKRGTVQFDPRTVDKAVLTFVLNRLKGEQLRDFFDVVARVLPVPLPAKLGKPSRSHVFILDQIATNRAPFGDLEALLGFIGYSRGLIDVHLRTGVAVVVSPSRIFTPFASASWQTVFDLVAQDQTIGYVEPMIVDLIVANPYDVICDWGGPPAEMRRGLETRFGCHKPFTGTGQIAYTTRPGQLTSSECLTPNRSMQEILPLSAVIYISS